MYGLEMYREPFLELLLMLIRKKFYGISGIILLDRYYDLCTFDF